MRTGWEYFSKRSVHSSFLVTINTSECYRSLTLLRYLRAHDIATSFFGGVCKSQGTKSMTNDMLLVDETCENLSCYSSFVYH
jgi:hypothetical protein